MTEELDVLLSGLTVAEEGEAACPDGLRLRVRGYLTDAAPPLACVSSVRAVVLRGEEVLVFRDRGGRHRRQATVGQHGQVARQAVDPATDTRLVPAPDHNHKTSMPQDG